MYGTEPDTLRGDEGCNVNLCWLQRLSHTTQGLLLQRRSIPVLLYIASRKCTQHSLPSTSQGLYRAEVPLRHTTTNLVGTAALTKDHTSARHFSGVVDCCCMGSVLPRCIQCLRIRGYVRRMSPPLSNSRGFLPTV
jgi:hypothetical protein